MQLCTDEKNEKEKHFQKLKQVLKIQKRSTFILFLIYKLDMLVYLKNVLVNYGVGCGRKKSLLKVDYVELVDLNYEYIFILKIVLQYFTFI